MPSAARTKTLLVVETDVIVRFALADYLRVCGFAVVEAASALEAKTVLQRGPLIYAMLADARLAGEEGGFALAQWTRRYRPGVAVILTGSLASKSEAVARLCGQNHPAPPPVSHLRDRIKSMRAHRLRGAAGPGRPPRSRASG